MAVDRRYPESELTDKIIRSAISVHKDLKSGFVEKVYQRALYLELKNAGLKFEREEKVGLILNFGKLVLEIKRVIN